MIRTTIKHQLTNEVLYGPADFAEQSQLDTWLAVRFPQENRRIEKSEAQTLHGEDYAAYLVEEVIENFDGEDVTISVLKPLAKVESTDVTILLLEQKIAKENLENRNKFLKDTDFTQLSDVPLSSAEKQEYRDYRRYLRCFPLLIENQMVNDPYVKNFADWKLDKPTIPAEWTN